MLSLGAGLKAVGIVAAQVVCTLVGVAILAIVGIFALVMFLQRGQCEETNHDLDLMLCCL